MALRLLKIFEDLVITGHVFNGNSELAPSDQHGLFFHSPHLSLLLTLGSLTPLHSNHGLSMLLVLRPHLSIRQAGRLTEPGKQGVTSGIKLQLLARTLSRHSDTIILCKQ